MVQQSLRGIGAGRSRSKLCADQRWSCGRHSVRTSSGTPQMYESSPSTRRRRNSRRVSRARTRFDLAFAHEPQVIELTLNFRFGSNAGVKGRAQAGLFEQPASFLANLHPLLVGLSIAPFVQQAAANRERTVGVTQNGAPVRRQIEEPGDHRPHRSTRPEMEAAPLRRPETTPCGRRS